MLRKVHRDLLSKPNRLKLVNIIRAFPLFSGGHLQYMCVLYVSELTLPFVFLDRRPHS